VFSSSKTIFGVRYALTAQKNIYNQDVVDSGPHYSDIIWPLDSASTSQSIILRFSPSLAHNAGLILRDTSRCSLCCSRLAGSAFVLHTSDGRNVRATVTVRPEAFLVVITAHDLPIGVRVDALLQGYENYQECALYNQFNLPLLPFNVTR